MTCYNQTTGEGFQERLAPPAEKEPLLLPAMAWASFRVRVGRRWTCAR